MAADDSTSDYQPPDPPEIVKVQLQQSIETFRTQVTNFPTTSAELRINDCPGRGLVDIDVSGGRFGLGNNGGGRLVWGLMPTNETSVTVTLMHLP